MRKLSVLLVGLVIGGAAGVAAWEVGFAAEPADTLVVCTRPGADVRTPAPNGNCPSGYTKVEITESGPLTNPAYSDNIIASIDTGPNLQPVSVIPVPAGSYTFVATVGLHTGSSVGAAPAATAECALVPQGAVGFSLIEVDGQGGVPAEWVPMNGAFILAAPVNVELRCRITQTATVGGPSYSVSARVTITQVSSIN